MNNAEKNNAEKLIRTAAETLGVDAQGLTLESKSSEIESWDSLMHINLVSQVEEDFGTCIPIDQVATIQKIGDFMSFIK